MRITVVGAGPGGLYFAILMMQADPSHRITVLERNRPDDTFGFGVVFSDATIAEVEAADRETYRTITDHFFHWDDIDVHYRGERLSTTGHGFSGMSRHLLLHLLRERAEGLGVEIRYETEVTSLESLREADLVVGADGVNSTVRRLLGDRVEPRIDERPNRFVWLGTTRPFPAFTFDFRESPHGLWRLHAYQYLKTGSVPEGEPISTFIVECTEETWRAAGMDRADEEATRTHCEALFQDLLGGHGLVGNRSIWRSFPTLECRRWWWENVVLLGDAVHTAHFSVGSGTRMAMLDAIALRDALVAGGGGGAAGGGGPEVEARFGEPAPGARAGGPAPGPPGTVDLSPALQAYEEERRPAVESLQRAAQASLRWFEDTERYMDLHPLQFTFALLTRSLRITHEDIRQRDPAFLDRVDRWFAEAAEDQSGVEPEAASGIGASAGAAGTAPNTVAATALPPGVSGSPGPLHRSPPPAFTPFRLRELVLPNRVAVSPMCQYSAVDGMPNDWHLVHLGSRAVGGAGLLWTEMTDVSPEGRISPGCTGIYRDEHVGGWKRIVDFVHAHSDAKIGMQLGHAGRKGATRRMWEGDNEPLEEGGWEVVSASPIPYLPHSPVPREMSRADMDQVVEEYRVATERALEAGFDLLEVHMAHGYLLASFISPLTNTREDAYGGSLENRMRFPLEVFDAVRGAWPQERPLSVRISAVDWKPGGMEAEDAVEVARMLRAHACDVVDVSAGQTVPDQRPRYGRLFQTPFSDRIRHEVGMATMAVGGISSFTDVNTILAAGRADLCLLARAHLWNPYWSRHAAHALEHPLPWPPQYESLDRYTPWF
jgi:anthraniloyl-CoA monooxygenase